MRRGKDAALEHDHRRIRSHCPEPQAQCNLHLRHQRRPDCRHHHRRHHHRRHHQHHRTIFIITISRIIVTSFVFGTTLAVERDFAQAIPARSRNALRSPSLCAGRAFNATQHRHHNALCAEPQSAQNPQSYNLEPWENTGIA